MEKPIYSLLFPVYNEEAVLSKLKQALVSVLKVLDGPYEIIFVDDGSTDRTLEFLRTYADENPRIKVVSLSRNFGHQAALAAGLAYAQGSAVMVLDADLQDPPELLLAFIDKWREGYDVVYGIRKEREGESWFKKATANVFYRIVSYLSDVSIPHNTGDFRLLDRKVVDTLLNLNEQHLFWRGLVAWVGFRQIGIEFVRKARAGGTTHYPFRKMIKFALDGITSFSVQPLKLATLSGFLIALSSFLFGAWAVVTKLLNQESSLSGWTSLMTAVLFIGGIQLIMIGFLGEYIGRIFEETKRRPIYIVRDTINMKNKSAHHLNGKKTFNNS